MIKRVGIFVIIAGLMAAWAGTAEAGWLSGYGYRALIPVNDSGGAQSDYQMQITVHSKSDTNAAGDIYCNGHLEDTTNFNDIRFTESNGTSPKSFWIEKVEDETGGRKATVWVELNTPASGTTNYYIYYGKAGDTSGSDGGETFLFFDDFEDGSYTDKWDANTIGGASVSETGGNIEMTAGSGYSGAGVTSKNTISSGNWVIEAHGKRDTGYNGGEPGLTIGFTDKNSQDTTYYGFWDRRGDGGINGYPYYNWKLRSRYDNQNLSGPTSLENWDAKWARVTVTYLHSDKKTKTRFVYGSTDTTIGPTAAGTNQLSSLYVQVHYGEVDCSGQKSYCDWVAVRKYAATEPGWASPGGEVMLSTVTTQAATSVEETTATGNGNITDTGGENASAWGVCYNTTGNPTTADSTAAGSGSGGSGAFTASMTSLNAGTKYYVKAYATNSAGTSYGAQVDFTTKPNPPTALSASTISQTQIDVSWTKGSGAEKTMVRRKVDSYPSSVSDGNEAYFDTGSSFNDTSLTCGTHYYYRAWSYKTGAPSSGYSDGYAENNAATSSCNTGPTAPTQLLCEGASDPTGVTDTTPEFSAIFNDPDVGDTSNAYEIHVGTSADPINSPNMWDSGWLADSTTESQRCSDKSYAGSSLSWGTKYYWAIRFRDVGDAEGTWSSVANFTMLSAGGLTISDGDNNPAAETILNNATNEEMVQLKLTAGSSEGVNISSITFTGSGTGDEANDITANSVKLYNDINNNGTFDSGTDTQIGTDQSWSGDNGTATFSGLSESISASSSENWLLLCSFAGGIVDGKTFQVNLANNNDITAVGAVTAQSITASGAPVEGGVKTIGAISGAPTVTVPENGKTLGTGITVIGTAPASSTVTIKDQNGNTVGTTTADSSGNYRLSLSELSAGSNELTPYVGETAGSSRSVTVVSSPSTDQVPTISSPGDGANINKADSIVSGKGLAGQSVVVKALDSSGNLITAGSGTVDSEGNYEVTLTASLPEGDNYLSVTVNGVSSGIIKVTLIDPYGIVFDSVTDNPVQGAVVSLYKSDGTLARAGEEIASTDANPQTTDEDGKYSFNVINGTYYLQVSAAGYDFPSEKTSFPAGRTIGTGSKGEEFTVAGEALELDIPVDANLLLLKIEKEANKKEVQIGEVVTYQVKLKNETSGSVINVYLEDKIPAGFKYLDGKAILDSVKIADPTGRRPLTFNIGTVEGNSERLLKYQLVVGSGVTFGKYENKAFAKYSGGTRISNLAREEVKIVPQALFDLGTVIGKVFWDIDENQIQNAKCKMKNDNSKFKNEKHKPETKEEKKITTEYTEKRKKKEASDIGHLTSNQLESGIPHVRIVTEEGTVIITDRDGKFHLAGIVPGRHLFRLDESTLPDRRSSFRAEGAYLTTDKVVVVNITPGVLAKVNFGANKLTTEHTEKRDKRQTTETQKNGDTEPYSNIRIVQEREISPPRLNVSLVNAEIIVEEEKLVMPAEFRIFTNYTLFIENWKLEILDDKTRKLIKVFEGNTGNLYKPIFWNGRDKEGNLIKAGRIYIYVLTVYDKNGKWDRTKKCKIQSFDKLRIDPERSRTGQNAKFKMKNKEEKSEQKRLSTMDWRLSTEHKENNLEVQSIPIRGGTVTIHGEGFEYKMDRGIRKSLSQLEIISIEVSKVVEDKEKEAIIITPPETVRLEEISRDIILPPGKYKVAVTKHPSGEAGGFLQSAAELSRTVNIKESYFFFVALADGEVGWTKTKGNIEPVKQNDKFREGFWSEGKLAYYLKGKIKEKYLITSSLDTKREKKELFAPLDVCYLTGDPDKYYPVYGDASTINYDATNTQGMLYLLIEWDKSSLLWGNYETGFTESELAYYSRTLYGGKLHCETVSTTQFGDSRSKLIVFGAKAKQKAAHNEFLGTGGSLYYLKHREVMEGSDKVVIEVRDKITGLVLEKIEQKEGSDYEIDYANGRITFHRPVAWIAESDSIISTQLLDGDPIYVVVDYEYEVRDKYDEGSYGVRASQTITDYLKLGATYVKEEKEDKNYQLKGFDATLYLGKDTELVAEYAESESEEVNSFISRDGGLNFTQLSTSESAKGKAYGIKGETNFLDNFGATGYYKRIEEGFSTSSTISQQGKELIGAGLTYDISSQTRVNVSHDIQKLIKGGNLETALQVGAEKTETSSAQIVHTLKGTGEKEKLRLTGEYRRNRVTEPESQFNTESNEEGDIAAARIDYYLNPKIELSLEQQATIKGSPNHQTTAGIVAEVFDWLDLKAQETVGTRGSATSLGMETENDKFTTYGYYNFSNSHIDGRKRGTVFGGKRRLNENLDFMAEREYSRLKDSTSNTNILGLSGDINERLGMRASYKRGFIQHYDGKETKRNAGSVGLSYVNRDSETGRAKLQASTKLELRLDEGEEDKRQFLTHNAVEWKVIPDLTLFAQANFSETENKTSEAIEAEYKEFVTGLAYRPINFDRLNLLAQCSYLSDDSPSGQSDTAGIDEEKAYVYALEGIYDFTARLQVVEKFAYKIGEEKVTGFDFTKTNTWLWINRLNYEIADKWQLGGEYRLLTQKEAEDERQGVLIELVREFGDHIQLGGGYNWTDFNDDLTDLDYTCQGPFLRLTGKFYDRTPEELKRIKEIREERKIERWAEELIDEELAPVGGKVMEELYNCLCSGNEAYEQGRFEEAKEFYQKILERGKEIYQEAEVHVREQIAFEKKLKGYDDLAKVYYKEGKLEEAKALWQRLIREATIEVGLP